MEFGLHFFSALRLVLPCEPSVASTAAFRASLITCFVGASRVVEPSKGSRRIRPFEESETLASSFHLALRGRNMTPPNLRELMKNSHQNASWTSSIYSK
jgi:hypothetical protein